MAGPQVEEGFTRLAHGYLEALVRADITGREMRVLMVIARNTWGRHGSPKLWPMGLSFLSEASGIERRTVARTVATLIGKNMVLQGAEQCGTRPRELGIQKHPERWLSVASAPTPKGGDSTHSSSAPSVASAPTGGWRQDPPHGGDRTHSRVATGPTPYRDKDSSKTSLRQGGVSAPPAKKKKRGSKFAPKSWEPKPEATANAVELLGADGAAQALVEFREFEFARPYTDWDRCWSRWYRRQAEFQARRKGGASVAVPDRQATDYGEMDLSRSALGGGS